MTQEEKAKAYDKVREKIAVRFGSNVADEIFSQFEMSEDERIRKELIEHINRFKTTTLSDLKEREYDSWIAWLEKQGEKPQGKSALDAINQEKVDNANKVEPKFKVGDKIKLTREPKYPAREIIAIQNDAYYFDKLVYLQFRYQDEWEIVEQNPAWSEEEEDVINKAESWLDTLCDYLKDSSSEYISDIKDVINKLKFLKERYTWKPSDEQIKACKEVYADVLSAKGFDVGTIN